MAAMLWLGIAATASAEAPARVVSTNLCTDQIALMLADPGQLVSVSFLSQDPRSSNMAEAATRLPANRGRAEEIYLLEPDLVLAGTYSTQGAVPILRDLGVRVETLPPADGFDDVFANIRQVGDWMGQGARAAAIVDDMRRDLAALDTGADTGARVALYGPGGYTTGARTLADDILARAGLINVATEAGLPGGGNLSLERLVMLAPDMLLSSDPYAGHSQAEALLTHPAIGRIGGMELVALSDATGWSCETPHLVQTVRELRRAAEDRG